MSEHSTWLSSVRAGMAGVAATNKCAAHGWDVAIVDALPYGGTCALRGATRRRSCGPEAHRSSSTAATVR